MKKMLTLEITLKLYEQLRVEAFKQHVSISALVRNILGDYFDGKTNI